MHFLPSHSISFNQTQVHLSDQTLLFDEEASRLRWFMLPSEAYQILKSKNQPVTPAILPFEPPTYPLSEAEIEKRKAHLKKIIPQNQLEQRWACGDGTKHVDDVQVREQSEGILRKDAVMGGGECHPVAMVMEEGKDVDDKNQLDDRTKDALGKKSNNTQMFIDSINEGFTGSHDLSHDQHELSCDRKESGGSDEVSVEESRVSIQDGNKQTSAWSPDRSHDTQEKELGKMAKTDDTQSGSTQNASYDDEHDYDDAKMNGTDIRGTKRDNQSVCDTNVIGPVLSEKL